MWDNLVFRIMSYASKRVRTLNKPIIYRCPINGKGVLVAYKESRKGTHFICTQCFTALIKPRYFGDFYKSK